MAEETFEYPVSYQGKEMTPVEKLRWSFRLSIFCVWESDQACLLKFSNGYVLLVDDRLYRIGQGDAKEIDGYLPMFRGEIGGPMHKMVEAEP